MLFHFFCDFNLFNSVNTTNVGAVRMWLCNKKNLVFLDVVGTVYQVFVNFNTSQKYLNSFFLMGHIILKFL